MRTSSPFSRLFGKCNDDGLFMGTHLRGIGMAYVVWVADLNSLYNEQPNAPVVHEMVNSEFEAQAMVKELQDHETAAWYRPEAA